MLNQGFQKELDQTAEELKMISKESEQPGGGNPEFLICWSVKNCMAKFLITYLNSKSVDTSKMLSIADLIHHSILQDKEFSQVDIEQLSCRNTIAGDISSSYCLTPGHMKHCIDEANKIREIVYRKLELKAV